MTFTCHAQMSCTNVMHKCHAQMSCKSMCQPIDCCRWITSVLGKRDHETFRLPRKFEAAVVEQCLRVLNVDGRASNFHSIAKKKHKQLLGVCHPDNAVCAPQMLGGGGGHTMINCCVALQGPNKECAQTATKVCTTLEFCLEYVLNHMAAWMQHIELMKIRDSNAAQAGSSSSRRR